jgi:hypothetical protein
MAARPAPVRIDDLADPVLPPHVVEMMQALEPLTVELDFGRDAVLDAARAETGLDDFGDEWFREPLGVVLGALDRDAGLSAFGRMSAYTQMVGHMRNRLRVERLLEEHPEIVDVTIDRPIFIVGQPRTGTTHLHNLMAADPALRSLPYWESLEPVLSDAEHAAVAAGGDDPRRERCAVGLDVLNDALPYFKRMHDMTVDHVHEEIQLLAMAGSTMLFETMAVMPVWRDWYCAHDQTAPYRYLKKVLQCCQWLRGGERLVLKSPQHLEQFGPLVSTFPDATIVVTHRDPVAVTTSLVTMMAYTARMHTARPDPAQIGRYWSARVEQMLMACVRDRELLPPHRSIDVRFDEFMADDVGMVERIYEVAGQPMTGAARQAMDAFMTEHPRGRHGTVVYDLSQFGLDAKERREALAAYSARFAVATEDAS